MITEINGVEFILLTQQKTDKKVYIPVDRRVRQILDKYDGKLPHIHPNEMNKLIKTVGLMLGWTHDCGFDGSGSIRNEDGDSVICSFRTRHAGALPPTHTRPECRCHPSKP